MTDFLDLMKQAAELKSKMEAMQAELDRIEVEGSSGAGLVVVRLSGKGEMKGVTIDASQEISIVCNEDSTITLNYATMRCLIPKLSAGSACRMWVTNHEFPEWRAATHLP